MTDTGTAKENLPEDTDPGQLEGRRPKPSDNLKEGMPRFDEVYGKMKDFERKFTDSEEANKGLMQAVEAMKEHTSKVSVAMTKMAEGVVTPQEKQEADDAAVQAQATSDKLANLQTQLAEAASEEEYGKAIMIQNEINDLRFKALAIPDTDAIIEKVKETVASAKVKTPDDIILEKWTKDNEWYSDSEEARIFADGYGRTIWKEGMDYQEFLDKVSVKTVDVFKFKADEGDEEEDEQKETTPKKKVAAVEPGGATSTRRGKGKRQLTQEEKTMADTFDIPHDKYLDQVLFAEGGAQ